MPSVRGGRGGGTASALGRDGSAVSPPALLAKLLDGAKVPGGSWSSDSLREGAARPVALDRVSAPLPSNGPGEIAFSFFSTLAPPFPRGLKGAYEGFASAWRDVEMGDSLLRAPPCEVPGRGDAGNGGKAQSLFNGRSGDGGLSGGAIGLVTLLFSFQGILPLSGDRGE